MFKSGAKFLFGLAAFGFVAAVAYSMATAGHKIDLDSVIGPISLGWKGRVGDHVGYSVLVTLAFLSLFVGALLSLIGDADPEAEAAALGLESAPPAAVPATVNYWPAVAGFSVAALALGLAVGPILFVIGAVGLAIVTLEWAVRTWSDRLSGDAEVNRTLRNQLMFPFEIPAAAVIVIALLVLAVSRILLALPKNGGYVIFGVIPAVILAVGALFVLKPKLSQSALAGLLVVGGLAILAGGVVAAIAGEREHEGGHHEEETHEADGEGEGSLAPLPAPGEFELTVGN